jgi:hypothetical protein
MSTISGMAEASTLLRTDRVKARQLVRSGYLGDYEETPSGRLFINTDRLKKAAAVPDVQPPHPAALVVRLADSQRVDPPDPAWPDREYIGYHSSMSADQIREASRGWWRVSDPESWHGRLLVSSIVGFVLGAWKITGHENGYGGARRFTITEPGSKDGADKFLNHRLITGAGGTTAFVDAQDWPTG